MSTLGGNNLNRQLSSYRAFRKPSSQTGGILRHRFCFFSAGRNRKPFSRNDVMIIILYDFPARVFLKHVSYCSGYGKLLMRLRSENTVFKFLPSMVWTERISFSALRYFQLDYREIFFGIRKIEVRCLKHQVNYWNVILICLYLKNAVIKDA